MAAHRLLRCCLKILVIHTLLLTLLLAAALAVVTVRAPAARADACTTSPQSVACENTKPGADPAQWEVTTSGPSTIEGFATSMSVNVGQTVTFKINTPATGYTIGIYRMGYYGGKGARLIAGNIPVSAKLPQTQPTCISDSTTGLVDCGNWAVSASWQVPATAVSGIYFAHLVRTDQPTGDDAHIIFVVRNDAAHSDLLFKTSDATWQAYNKWGLGNDFYAGDSSVAPGRAVKISYNRPFTSRSDSPWGRDFVWANEYPMVRFLEGNGYDISYTTDADVDANGALLKNHKAFLSVGHDEYWSLNERTNVEAARDAGVNLAFFSGNEVFWKTRWEASTDGTGTPRRTLVSYKETWANAKIDPSGYWTGTWRDPRFSPPYDGGRPENQLTGSLTMVICCGVALQVPPSDGLMRLWRNTSVATNALAGKSSTLADQTVGYEWDEDLDNGFRPAGAFELSTTTAGPGQGNGYVQQLLTDYGSTNTVEGTATHHLMMYRAPSGALVFGAGTVQWSWGLDPNHDGAISSVNPGNGPSSPDPAIQQATVNLFADMGIQPPAQTSLSTQTALGQAVAQQSVDSVPPTSTITSPAAGSTIANGKTITISGTAGDVGGQVAGVEVSTDGGTTWHRATGRGNWTYTWDAVGNGSVTIKSRAVDDSGNLETPGAGTTVTVTCPCRLFGDSVVPATADSGDASALEAGVKFQSSVGGWIDGVRFYKSANNTGTHTISLWDANGNRMATGPVTGETASGWQTGTFPTAIQIQANTTYVVSYYAPNGHYSGDANYFAVFPRNAPPLTAPKAADVNGNGVYRAGSSGFPTSTYNGGNYYVDPLFYLTQPPDTQPPAVTSATPLPGSSSVPTSSTPTVTFNKPVVPTSPTFTVKDGTTAIGGTASFDSTNTVYTFTPSAALPNGHTLTATVTGAADKWGNVMPAYSYSFTVAKATPPPGVCPCSIWNDSTTPSTVTVNDPTTLELGVRFTADADGTVSGIRFYKGPNNTGTHTGTLWSASGTQLATATFSNESTQGWQQVTFASPVAVKAGTSYIASYHTNTGYYSADSGGLHTQVDNPPLHALADASGAPNGVYAVGAHAFPSQSYNSANYWVDVVYAPTPDTTPPVVSSISPSAGATSVPTTAKVQVTFGEAMQTSGAGTLTVTDPSGASVAGSASFDGSAKVLTFAPTNPLAAATKYTVSVSGFKDADGNAMASTVTSSFTTSGATACPCSIWASDATPSVPAVNDSGSVELGVKFTADVAGSVTGIRFYKGTGNTGTHTATLWDSSGNQLATGTFANETASGWQTLTFGTPVPITAGATYVASYHAPSGHYAADGGYFGSTYDNPPLHALSNTNGVYNYSSATSFPNQTYNATNYWVDPIFKPT